MPPEEESIKTVISSYLFKYLMHFRLNLEKAKMEYDAEAIHEYRVAVKRIRSIISAVNQLFDEPVFPKKMMRPLRVMFKAGGTIRDDQVQIDLVSYVEKEFKHSFPLIRSFYETRIETRRDVFFIQSVDFEYTVLDDIRDQILSNLDPLDEARLETALHKWLNLAMEKLKRRRYDLDKPDKLHEFRTRFKETGYVIEMLFQSKYDYKITKTTHTKMKNFGLELGNWHDHYQLWSKTAFIFQESRDIGLLEEALELRKLLTPIHDKLFQEILHLIKRDDSLFEL